MAASTASVFEREHFALSKCFGAHRIDDAYEVVGLM